MLVSETQKQAFKLTFLEKLLRSPENLYKLCKTFNNSLVGYFL